VDTNKLTGDLRKLANSQVVVPLTQQLGVYEKRAKDLVKELDLRSRDARDKSKARLDEFLVQLKKTRTEVESKVRALFEEESKRLNARVNDLLETLRAVAQSDSSPKTAAAPKASATTKRKKAGTGARKSSKKGSARASNSHATTTH
jgi:hypothetical protein